MEMEQPFERPYAQLPRMVFERQEPPPNWVEHLERLGFAAGYWSQTHSEGLQEWRSGRARPHSI